MAINELESPRIRKCESFIFDPQGGGGDQPIPNQIGSAWFGQRPYLCAS